MSSMTDSVSEAAQILRDHARRYSLMEPADAVKLLYQQEFGGGHLISDEESCLRYLRSEYAGVPHDAQRERREALGNGVFRVHLAALEPEALEELGQAFIRSAAEHTGRQERFLQKLDVLRRLTAEGIFAFDSQTLERYLAAYCAAGCPAVSHSHIYRQHYRPAYRVILEKYAQLFE